MWIYIWKLENIQSVFNLFMDCCVVFIWNILEDSDYKLPL